MKYGIIIHKTTMNLGDDIQSYAAARQLPEFKYCLPRENLDSFKSDNNEPVGVIMNAWWMWQKWNWPPAESIYPLMISMHMNNYTIYRKASPIQGEWLEGIGGEYFRAYGPVGSRDNTTVDFFKQYNIDTYFSGCLTLTIPKQKKTADAGTYVCLVDLKPDLEKKAREWLKDSGLEIRTFTHHCDYRKSDATIEQRFDVVEDILTQYQNAKFVVTRRLHVTLPCLALETPVVSIVNLDDIGNKTRWEPYADWVRYISDENFLSGNFEYDYNNPPANKPDYLPTRNALIETVQKFVNETKDFNGDISQIKKTSYSEEQAREWQNNLMHWTLETWLHKNRGLLEDRNNLKKEVRKLKKVNGSGNLTLKDIEKLMDYKKQITLLEHKIENMSFVEIAKKKGRKLLKKDK